ncbi:UDP-2,3-diacylglucosamine diphosphatase [Acidithiobacillus sp. IBUN Pt1247-S3]|uniref:UDP-2,3-diacylglucosamine diphosphatase n=1 Tax=Acidithiobacillus sp. IBUN Pt1247-S3 TaxID=3166642 RepID=UPI0034E4B192
MTEFQQATPSSHLCGNCRTIFVSDIHLGSKGCQAEALLEFFRHYQAEQLYLVGDIIDFWALKRRWYWPSAHSTVIQKVLRQARAGVKVTYVQGNHDPVLSLLDSFLEGDEGGLALGEIQVVPHCLHETADGRRLWITHGDQFDLSMHYARWLTHLGDRGYGLLLTLNRWHQRLNRLLGIRSHWSLSAFIKHRIKRAVQFISQYEEFLARECRRAGYHGVVCGHIHHAEMKNMNGIEYYNDGDWVESCTALVEDFDGTLRLVRWPEADSVRKDVSPLQQEAG